MVYVSGFSNFSMDVAESPSLMLELISLLIQVISLLIQHTRIQYLLFEINVVPFVHFLLGGVAPE